MPDPKELEPFLDKDYRDSYLDGHVKGRIAYQIFQLRKDLNLSQAEFGKLISQAQTIVSRLENTEYGAVTVNTLIKIAQGLGIGLEIRFCDYEHLVTSSVSPEDFGVENIQQTYDRLAKEASGSLVIGGSKRQSANRRSRLAPVSRQSRAASRK